MVLHGVALAGSAVARVASKSAVLVAARQRGFGEWAAEPALLDCIPLYTLAEGGGDFEEGGCERHLALISTQSGDPWAPPVFVLVPRGCAAASSSPPARSSPLSPLSPRA